MIKHPVLAQLNPSVVHTSATLDNAFSYKTPDQSSPTDSATLESTEERNVANKLKVPEVGNEYQPNQTNKGVDQEREQSADSEEEEDLLDEQSIDSFERAFRAILTTRERVGQLDHASRRKMAEKLTLQLWRAVGGSPDEVDGLSTESSDEVDGT
ncbi:unnamed protein product [Echinostoma caproni]|uniref:Uncharacterized protein n=1 Tax=Echinostoma caproni TaxID=27848 RepID=A0A3P8GEJ0_9TREM|nr:unnamed protein product [Echinostoma caproni]